MKRKRAQLLFPVVTALLMIALVGPGSAAAHPGRTDATGGHHCRTNCPAYGLAYGQYHHHGGTGSASSGSGGSTSVITQADCDNRRIRRQGRTLTTDECEKLIGQRVSLANTGFEAWIFGLGGAVCLLAAVGLRRSRPRGGAAA
jgi:hypothetical protein